MSIEIMSRAWEHSQHTGSSLLLLLALADHASDDGVCWPGIPRLAKKTRKTERHTQRLLVQLEESGELYISRAVGRKNTNLYLITIGFTEDEIRQTLVSRFEIDCNEAAQVARQIISRLRKGDGCVTFPEPEMVTSTSEMVTSTSEMVTSTSEMVTSTSENGDIAMSPEPSITIIKSSIESSENLHTQDAEKTASGNPKSSPPASSKFATFRQGDDYLNVAAKCAASQIQAGDFAIPAQAGGAFALGDQLITAACCCLGRSEPEGQKRILALAFFEKALQTEGLLQGDTEVLEGAVRDWLAPEGEYAFFLSQYDLNPKHELALRHFGIVLSKAKRKAIGEKDRRARAVEMNESSLDAFEVCMAATSRPADDTIGIHIKANLEALMERNLFAQYVRPCAIIVCDDSTLVVTAPDAFTRDWLENRLGLVIRKMLPGFPNALQEVVFEVRG